LRSGEAPIGLYYIELINAYSSLAKFLADLSPDDAPTSTASLFKLKSTKRRHQQIQCKIKKKLKDATDTDDMIIEQYINMAEDERTEMAKSDKSNMRKVAIDTADSKPTKPILSLLQQSKNLGLMLSAATRRLVRNITNSNQHRVTFAGQAMVAEYNTKNSTVMIRYDSGADGHYISEKDRKTVGLPILRISAKKVDVANGSTCKGQYVTALPFPQLSTKAAEADTFNDLPTSLMSIGKTADNGNISIFTKEGVSVYKEEDVLITCKGEAILIGKRDERGRYIIPLVQNLGNWQPKQPIKHSKKYVQQANSVYDLPSTEEAIKWMHTVCGYPVKSTWLKAVKAENYISWMLLTEWNVNKFYPETTETTETPKGHMTQTRKNVRSTKAKPTTWEQPAQSPLKEPNTSQLMDKKVRDVFTPVYDIRETVFSNKTGRFPTRSQQGNKYIMVMVEIGSNAILVEPISSRNNHELARSFRVLMTRLLHAGIVPKKHILDSKVSEAMKTIIKNEYKMAMEHVPPGCHRSNAAEVAIQIFKAHFLSVLAGAAEDFPFIMGPPPPTDRNITQPVAAIQCDTNGLSLRTLMRTI